MLTDRMRDPLKRSRREVVDLIRKQDRGGTEGEALLTIRSAASESVRAEIDAIVAYERMSHLAMGAFTAAQVVSTSQGWATVGQLAQHHAIGRCVRDLPAAFRKAVSEVDTFGMAVELNDLISDMAMAAERGPDLFVEAMMTHHQLIQLGKPPGKRTWFERSQQGYCVRPPYRREDVLPPGYIHPYRIQAVRRFLQDLR
jgi:hypothetical protein